MKNLLLLFLILPLYSCTNECEGDCEPSPHYIDSYLETNSIELRVTDISVARPDWLKINFIGNYLHRGDPKFDELSKHYNDTSYKGGGSATPIISFAHEISGIDVTCNRDFDAEHPAGSSLRDRFVLNTATWYDFISSGYKSWYYPNSGYQQARLISKYLHELKPDELKLISTNWVYLSPDRSPQEPGQYEFTVTVHQQKPFTATIAVIL